jgi:predicted nucleic acid-binding protein
MTFLVDPAPVVLDASVTVDLAIGERPDTLDAVERWLSESRMLIVPAVHWTEVGHALMRRMAGDPVRGARRIEQVASIGLETADRGPAGVAMAMAVAARHGLSIYDASYLWLAIDVDGELATFDRALARAALAEDVPLALV